MAVSVDCDSTTATKWPSALAVFFMMLRTEHPSNVVASSPCGPWLQINNLKKDDLVFAAKWAQKKKQGRRILRNIETFMEAALKIAGCEVFSEQPVPATSQQEPFRFKLLAKFYETVINGS